MEEVTTEGGQTKVVEGGAAVVTEGASKVLENISTMRLIVELRELAITAGFISLVLFLDARLELGGCISLVNLASCLRFRNWLLLASLLVVTEPIEMSRCRVRWG